jgi:hypothetical protein
VRLWDVNMCEEIRPPEHGRTLRGPASCMTWMRVQENSQEILAFGTGLGYLVLWRFDQQKVNSHLRLTAFETNRLDSSVDSTRSIRSVLVPDKKLLALCGTQLTRPTIVLRTAHEMAQCSCGTLMAGSWNLCFLCTCQRQSQRISALWTTALQISMYSDYTTAAGTGFGVQMVKSCTATTSTKWCE